MGFELPTFYTEIQCPNHRTTVPPVSLICQGSSLFCVVYDFLHHPPPPTLSPLISKLSNHNYSHCHTSSKSITSAYTNGEFLAHSVLLKISCRSRHVDSQDNVTFSLNPCEVLHLARILPLCDCAYVICELIS